MPAAVAIPAAISAGSSIFGGLLGSSAASKAAGIQSQAATTQANNFQQMLAQYNPQIAAAGTAAAGGVNDATAAGQAGIGGAVNTGQAGLGSATQYAQGLLNPYITGGAGAETTLAQMMAPGGSLTQPFTASMMEQNDPGYAFRMAQASKALQGSAAARGGALGGGTASALMGLNSNLASSEYANAQQRYMAQQNQQYNMFSGQAAQGMNAANQAGQFGMTGATNAAQLGLTGATAGANLGLQGATTAGNFGTSAAQQQAANAMSTQQAIANLMTGGAAAQAAGTVGSANAWNGALGGVAGAAGQVGNYLQGQNTLSQLMKLMQNPATSTTRV